MANQGQISVFMSSFASKEHEVRNNLNHIKSLSDLDSVRCELQKLSQLVSEYAPILPSFELRKAQLLLSELQTQILEVEENLRPKKKFRFQRAGVSQKTEKQKTPDEIDSRTAKKETDNITAEPTLSGKSNEKIVLAEEDVSGKDIWLQSLKNCTVTINGIPSTLHLTQLNDCRIVTGPVATSVFLDDCQDSVFAMGCQQLRAHRSSNCDFYLHLHSRAIIEDCDKCRFAPYLRTDEGFKNDLMKAGYLVDVNNWNQVDDFNWLSQEERSPHWSVVPEVERITNWNF